jgi:predicted nucleic acid-binding protein
MFLAPFQVLSYPPEAAFSYGDIRAELERKGAPITGLHQLGFGSRSTDAFCDLAPLVARV